MGIQALEAPTRNVGSKYDFDAGELAAAAKLLKAGQWPGNTGYEKEGQARSAATRLIEQLQGTEGLDVGDVALAELGSRVWEGDKTTKWCFVLKAGKRKPNSGDGPAPE